MVLQNVNSGELRSSVPNSTFLVHETSFGLEGRSILQMRQFVHVPECVRDCLWQ